MMPNTGPHHSNSYSCYDGSNYGPTFGGGHDLYLCDNCNIYNSNYSNLGHSYNLNGYVYGSTQIKNFLAGSYNFMVSEIEIFKLK